MAGGFSIAEEVNIFYLCIMAMIIFTMQAGFAFLEAGSVRSKSTTTILLKNCLDTSLSAVVYWATGFAFGFGYVGPDSNMFIGYRQFFLSETEGGRLAYFFFEYTFAAASATIISGAMAERQTMISYLVYVVFATGWIYPVATHWAWSGQGWMSAYLQYTDFAGSGVVHIVGGSASLVGAAILGPRIGRFDENGRSNNIPGHSTVLVTLGYFFLWFGFLAFNAGSELGVAGTLRADYAARAATNTILAPSAAALTSVMCIKIGYAKEEVTLVRGVKVNTVHPFGGHWSLIVLSNGSITGMVAICAGCAYVEPWAAICIGAVAGVVYVCINKVIEMALIDDPLGSIAVHLGGGFWGVISVMLFAHPNRIPHIADGGVLYAWDRNAFVGLGKNMLGGACIFSWTVFWAGLLFASLHAAGHLRISPEAEEDGQDFIEGEPAYPIDLAVFSE